MTGAHARQTAVGRAGRVGSGRSGLKEGSGRGIRLRGSAGIYVNGRRSPHMSCNQTCRISKRQVFSRIGTAQREEKQASAETRRPAGNSTHCEHPRKSTAGNQSSLQKPTSAYDVAEDTGALPRASVHPRQTSDEQPSNRRHDDAIGRTYVNQTFCARIGHLSRA